MPYAALLGFYLGDGHVATYRGKQVLRISCDAVYPQIINDVSGVLRRISPHAVHHVRAPGCVVVTSGWKHWPCLFPQDGPGRKHGRTLWLAPWQHEIVTAHPGPFLRGLLHSDGCRVRNWARRTVAGEPKRYDYPRWQFVNASDDIRGFFCDALDTVDVPWRHSSARTISVSTREAVARLDALVGLKS